MNVATSVDALDRRPRALAVGVWDGVHLGHRRIVDALVAAGPSPTVVTLDPHPRASRGEDVPLLTTLERRLELLEAAGVADVLVLAPPEAGEEPAPTAFAEQVLRPLGTRVVITGPRSASNVAGRLDAGPLGALGVEVRSVPLVEGVSSARIRQLVLAGEVARAARLLGRPPEVDGAVVGGDRRGRTLGFPTANVAVDPELAVPAHGIYAGSVAGTRAAVSIGTNPQYGGRERRIEAFLLDFEGDLYGERLVVELWERLRDERTFASQDELVAQIGRDVEATRRAVRPV